LAEKKRAPAEADAARYKKKPREGLGRTRGLRLGNELAGRGWTNQLDSFPTKLNAVML